MNPYKTLETEFFRAKSLGDRETMESIVYATSTAISNLSIRCDLYEDWYGEALHPEDGIPKTPLEKRFEKLRQEYYTASRLLNVCNAYV